MANNISYKYILQTLRTNTYNKEQKCIVSELIDFITFIICIVKKTKCSFYTKVFKHSVVLASVGSVIENPLSWKVCFHSFTVLAYRHENQ